VPRDESVLVIPADHLRALGAFHGFRHADDAFRAALLDPTQFSFRPRSQVETDPNFKQLIPYVILRHADTLFQYRRGASGTETRLHALRSIGIGGHISTDDANGSGDPYTNGMMREVLEEVFLESAFDDRLLGFIYDDRTPVGSVHLGVVHLWELSTNQVRAREDGLVDGRLESLERVWAERDEFETWSQFALAELLGRSSP
jgi:predicted NUDIX family phosphoesterase